MEIYAALLKDLLSMFSISAKLPLRSAIENDANVAQVTFCSFYVY